MAKTITELTAAGAVDGANDLIWLEQSGLPKKISPDDLGIGAGAEVNNLTLAVTWANIPIANVPTGTTGVTVALGDHTQLLASGATDVTALAAEVNLLDLAGLTIGWVLSADSATTASWKAPAGGDVTKVGTPVNDQIGVWTGDGTLEGDVDLTFGAGNNLKIRTAGILELYDTANNDYIRQRHTGTIAYWEAIGATAVDAIFTGVDNAYNFADGAGSVKFQVDIAGANTSIRDGTELRVRSADDTRWLAVSHDATDIILDAGGVAAVDLNITSFTGDLNAGNYLFDMNQTVGAGTDNYVLTYDMTGGKISLEAAAGGGAAATTFIINADINTATPPTTELVTAKIVFNDLADDDTIGRVGFDGNNEFKIDNYMRGGDFVFSGITAAGTTINWLDWNPDGAMLVRSGDNLAMYVDRTSQCFQATGAGITGLHYAGIQTAQTTTRALGGWQAFNSYNGTTTYERVLTESDIHRGLPIGHYGFLSGVGGGDPGSGKVAFNNATPASITSCTIDDFSFRTHNMEWLYGQIGVGDVLIFGSDIDTADYITFTVDSVTDSTGYWTIGVTYVAGGTNFTNNDNVRMTWVPISQAAGGGAAATSFIINADINTATPPTTESVTAELVFRDLADDDQIGTVGFTGANDLEIVNNMEGTNAKVIIRGTKAGGAPIDFFEFSPFNASFIRSGWNMAMYCDSTQQFLQATANSITALYYNGISVVQTTTAATGGWVVDNDYNGVAGLERVLTESDIHRGLPIGHYQYLAGIGGGDPGAGAVAFNSFTPSSITTCYLDDTAHTTHNMEWLYGQIAVGDVLIFGSEVDTADYVSFTVDSVTDSTGYWTLGVTYVAGGTIFGSGQNVRMTWVPVSQAGGGSDTPWTANHDAAGFDLTDVGTLGIWDAGAADKLNISHDGTDLNFDEALGTTSNFNIKDEIRLKLWDATNTDHIQIWNDGTTASFFGTGLTSMSITGFTTVKLPSGTELMIADSTNIDNLYMSHDGTDFNMKFDTASSVTVDLNIVGLTGSMVMQDIGLLGPVLQDYGIASTSEVVATNAFTITYSEGPAFQVDLEAATAAVTGTIAGGAVSGDYGQITVKVEQDSVTAQTLTWAGGTMRWAGGTAHPVTTTVGGFTLYTFESWDGGTIWYAAGADYS